MSCTLCVVSLAIYSATYLRSDPGPFFQLLKNIELKTLDVRFQFRGPRRPGPAVVIVGIDQKSQDLLGRWPFPRSTFAKAINFLNKTHARVVAFDVNFPQPDTNSALEALHSVQEDYDHMVPAPAHTPGFEADLKSREAAADNDQQFADALSHYDNAVLGYFFISPKEAEKQNPERLKGFLDILSFQAYPQIVHPEYAKTFEGTEALALSPNLPLFANYAKNFGFFYTEPDPDGTVRRAPTVVKFQGSFYPSLDVAAAQAFTDNSLDQVKLVFGPAGVEKIALGKLDIPTDRKGFAQIDFDGPAQTFPWYSLADVVQGTVDPSVFQGKLVLVGITATGIGDMVLTPYSESTQEQYPGVEVHANMIDNILYQHFIRRGLREIMIDFALIILFSLGAGIMFSMLSPLRATVLLLFSLAAAFAGVNFLFSHYRMWVAAFLPMTTLFLTYAGIVSYRFFFEEGEKRRALSAFSQYLHPAVMRDMLSNKDGVRLGGEEKELTALFADIVGFTTLSEKVTPSQLVELLNEYLNTMTGVIIKNWGTLDKYIGDAIMAFWGAPYHQDDQALRACRAALEMAQALQRLQEGWKARSVPSIDIGVGINTGPMVVGNMGSDKRKNYTIMGDSVNLASRLEGLTRKFRNRLIISESSFLQVEGKVVARELDLIRVKGKTQPVKVYDLLGMAADSAQFEDLVSRFEKGLKAYRDAQWEMAIEIFQELVRDYPQDGPSRVFMERCQEYLAEPPEGAWDGVFVMKSK